MSFLSLPAWVRPAPDSAVAERLRTGKSAYIDAIHLLWSFWLFITPLFSGGYTWEWALFTVLSYPVFLWLFARTLLAPKRKTYLYALGMGVLSLLLLPRYPSGISYFVYGCVMLRPCNMTFPRYIGWLCGMNAAFVLAAWLIGYPWQMLVYIPITTFVIGIIINVEHRAHEKDVALHLSQEEVRRLAATAERERIGRDLHDLLGHTLSLITLKLELSRKLFDRDSEQARHELTDAEQIARNALAEVRAAVTGIRATDLATELASAHLMLESSGVVMHYEPPGKKLPAGIETVLALIVREAVTNIARHARATRAQVEMSVKGSRLHLCISDNGRGGAETCGNGLSGMQERIQALGGTLHLESPRDRGTTLRIQVPLLTSFVQSLPIDEDDSRQDAEKPIANDSPEAFGRRA